MSYRIYTELDYKIMKLNLLLYVSDKVDYFKTYRRIIYFNFSYPLFGQYLKISISGIYSS
jgi:hypothetical protein